MIKNYEIHDPVWTIAHPRNGYLKQPELDYIQEVCAMGGGVLLQRHNSLSDDSDLHWENDFWGNLVKPQDLFNSYEDALGALTLHYESLLQRHRVNVARTEHILEGLNRSEV